MPANDTGDFETVFYRSFDGLRLAARRYASAGTSLPLVCLAGLSRTARDFHELALRIASDRVRPRRVIAFDYRGRGASDRSPDPATYTIPNELRDVLDGLAALEIPRAVMAATSRGGILAMIATAVKPELIAATVLNDIGPAIEPDGLAEIRSYLGKTPPPADWPSAVATLKRLHAARFSGLMEEDWEAWARASFVERDGRPVSDYDRALTRTLEPPPEAQSPNGPPPDLWPQYRALAAAGPVLVLRGANSALLSAATVKAMVAAGPRVTAETVPGQGHPVLLRGAVNERIAAFLAAVPE